MTVRTSATDRLVTVDLAPFEEIDIGDDAGIDGVLLPEGAGPVAEGVISRLVAPPLAHAHLTAYRPAFGAVEEFPSMLPGMPNAVLMTPDGIWAVEGLTMAVGDEALVRTPVATPGTLEAEIVVDDVGAGPRAVDAVTTLVAYPATQRFLALLGPGSAALFTWDGQGLLQEDLDDTLPDIQAVELSGLTPADRRDAVFMPGPWPAP